MIYVEILGRMGNQMFSYAMARKLQSKDPGQGIAFDFSNFEFNDETWINYMEYFKCSNNVHIEKRKLNLIQRSVLYIYFKKRTRIHTWNDVRALEDRYSNILEIFGIYMYTIGYHQFRYKSMFKNKLVMGFYESPRFFDSINDIIRDDFSVEMNSDCAKKIAEDILQHTAIAVGVRRGDFVSAENKNYCDVCTPKYYEIGVEILKKKLESKATNLKVFFFTDDIEWTETNISCDLDKTYITSSVSGNLKPWEMLHLLSLCKYQVISNSSFFWWGQYLNDSLDKIVVAPDKWRNNESGLYNDIYQENWICIGAEG
ncbi:alpha-1,2-fucosyltransferase [Hominiventricola aquisgranensis]|uniref:Alpha-1,2-fucosyltransferase n=1 Tax=Hominiventricola aquisgranensis TaxID=3133164 RepID=A0ABV1I1W7_9FIRM